MSTYRKKKQRRQKLAKQIKEHGISSVQFKPELIYGVQLPPGAKLPSMTLPVAHVASEPRASISFAGKAFKPKDKVEVFGMPVTGEDVDG